LASELIEFVRLIMEEFRDFFKTEQRASAKLNAMFAILILFLIVVLLASSTFDKVIALLQSITGNPVGETPVSAILVAIFFLVAFCFASVLITARGERGSKPTRH
jgi:hypothetical protein